MAGSMRQLMALLPVKAGWDWYRTSIKATMYVTCVKEPIKRTTVNTISIVNASPAICTARLPSYGALRPGYDKSYLMKKRISSIALACCLAVEIYGQGT